MGLIEGSGLALSSVVCPSVYASQTGRLPEARRFEVFGDALLEPSTDPCGCRRSAPTRTLYIGDAEGALAHQTLWLERFVDLLTDLGLTVGVEIASDPFSVGGDAPSHRQRA